VGSLDFQEGDGNFIADVNGGRMRLMLSAFFITLSLVYSQFHCFPWYLQLLQRWRRRK